MSLEVLRSNVATHNATSPVGAPALAEASGQRRNDKVQQLNSPSKLMDAAEEMGLAISSKLDRKSLETRSVRQGQGANLEAITKISEYLDKLPDMPQQDKLRELVGRMSDYANRQSSSGGGLSQQDLLDILSEFDGDITHQFAALDIAIEHFERKGDEPALLSVLRLTKDALLERDGRDIKAGFAVAQIATDKAEEFGTDPATMRESFRRMLQEDPSFDKLFQALRSLVDTHHDTQGILGGAPKKMVESIREVILVQSEAASNGLRTPAEGLEPIELHAHLQELGKLKSLVSVVEGLENAIYLTARPFGQATLGISEKVMDIAENFFGFLSKSVSSPEDAQALLRPLMPITTGVAVLFSNNLLNLHRDVPNNVFPSDAARVQQQTTLSDMSGHLALQEEEEFQANKAGATAESSDGTPTIPSTPSRTAPAA
ncbi:HrpJ domain-containing protein [Polycladidibacter hongkongensis]|uniref:HrpJ domain-containing protein n=1 Tax=Polycladidibacter hongkongensis TaxID=1647556 RepID=UPI00082B1102|nr:HrpJ domain-containing protein [Pseudovibrio hongkongensis]